MEREEEEERKMREEFLLCPDFRDNPVRKWEIAKHEATKTEANGNPHSGWRA
jgi:hypothetical protein